MIINDHYEKVQLFNTLIGKTPERYNKNTELCLMKEEFSELYKAYRSKDKALFIDTIIDLYYYYLGVMWQIGVQPNWLCYRGSQNNSFGFDDLTNFEDHVITCLEGGYKNKIDNGLGYFFSMFMECGLSEKDFDNYFQIVHSENITKGEAINGKANKFNFKEKTTEKEEIISNSDFIFL